LKAYLAAAFARQEELNGYRKLLESRGHTVTSRWLNPGYHGMMSDDANDHAKVCQWAREDVEDVMAADTLISFTGDRPGSRGGRHVEFGIGLTAGKRLVLVGDRESPFHWWPGVTHLPDADAFLAWLEVSE
jgi:hypothetical protein